jgi:hypothetical protein
MPPRRPHPLLLPLLVAAAFVTGQALLVPLFAGPAVNAAPRDLPVVVAGPDGPADQLAARFEAAQPGAFEITRAPDQAVAEDLLGDRAAYAAFLLDSDGVSLLTASAASPTVAALLTQMAGEVAGGQPVPVVDVVPSSADDPRGAGFAAGFLPLLLTSILAGIALLAAIPGWRARLLGLVTFGALAGLVGAAVLQNWLGVLEGAYLANAAVIGLVALAASAAVAGLGAAVGVAGAGLGALLIFVVGNPLSAVAAAPELLPQPWGQVGQWLPPGAGGTLLRSVAWFEGAGAGQPLLVLTGWAALGLILVAVGRATFHTPAPDARGQAHDAPPANNVHGEGSAAVGRG